MPTFYIPRFWPAVVAVGVLGIGGFVNAAIGYVERTSDAAFPELVATASPTSNPALGDPDSASPLRAMCVKELRELSVFRCRNVIAFQVRAMDVRRSLIPIE